jgi:predicted nucleotidyltransferase
MNLEQVLSLKGIDVSSVLAEIEATIDLDASDLVLIVGSIAEGLGNLKSDIDVLLITSRPDDHRGDSAGDVTLVVDRCVIDVQIVQASTIERLLDRFAAWCRQPWNVSRAVDFTLDERTVLHRLRHGYTLYEAGHDRVRRRAPTVADLARLKVQVARHLLRTIQVDMVGYRDAGDDPSLMFAAQDLLGQAVDALTATYSLTNPNPKWRSRLLSLVPKDWEAILPIRPSGLSALDHMWCLHRAPSRPEREACRRHAVRTTTFARAVSVGAEGHVLGLSGVSMPPIEWRERDPKQHERPLPCLELDVDFILAEERIALARLNEFGPPLVLTPRDFAVVMLFDGTNTERDAESLIAHFGHGHERTSRLGRLISLVDQAGLTASSAAS